MIQAANLPLAIGQALAKASAATGVDFQLLAETARRESSFNASAKAATSSATGLFQFIESTWLDMVRKYGAEHGLAFAASQIDVRRGRSEVADPQTKRAILDLRFDPELSARMAAELARENAAALQSRIGRAPSSGELYAAHVLGAGGAAKLIHAAASGVADASALFPREAAANKPLFFANGVPRSAEALLAKFAGEGGAYAAPVTAESPPPARQHSPASFDPGALVAELTHAMLQKIPGNSEDSDRRTALEAYLRADANIR
jgi:hypothetical protein